MKHKCLDCSLGDNFRERYNRIDDEDWQPEYCGCEKTYDYFPATYCEDGGFENILALKTNNKSKYKRYNKYLRNKRYRKSKLKYIGETKCKYSNHLVDFTNYFNQIKKDNNGKIWSKQFYLSGKRTQCKKQTNKKVRQSYYVGNYGDYRRCFNFWNTLY